MSRYPRVSLILITYNQSRYVRQAIVGALSQDYDNLEIVISDDSSPDSTWSIIQEVVAATPTRHQVVITQTAGNQGLAGNVNNGVRHSSGEWLVLAAGDDISLPDRVSKLMAAVNDAPDIRAVASRWYSIDDQGAREPAKENPRKRFRSSDDVTAEEALAAILRITPFPRLAFSGTLTGATAAWHRSLFERFGLLPADLVFEDAALTLRARLTGRVRCIDERLVEYRKHAESLTNYTHGQSRSRRSLAHEQERQNTKRWSREATLLRCMARDLDSVPGPLRDQFMGALLAQAEAFDVLASWWTLSWGRRLACFPKFARVLSLSRMKLKLLLPYPLYLTARALTLKSR